MSAQQQPTRPRSITITAWVLIAMGAAWMVTNTANLSNEAARSRLLESPLPVVVQYIVMYTDLVVMIVSGIARKVPRKTTDPFSKKSADLATQ